MKIIITIDGGGWKGPAVTMLLKEVERKISRPLHEVIDLGIGTSIGSVILGALCSGRISAEKTHTMMCSVLDEMTEHKAIFPPLYSRVYARRAYLENIGDIKMRDMATRYMSTACSMTDGRTHFFKSWDTLRKRDNVRSDAELQLWEVVERAFAAPLYFGSVDDKERDTSWQDGGTGIENCPVLQAVGEIPRLGWHRERVHILSIGCGRYDETMTGRAARRAGLLRQIGFFMQPANGGLARVQATPEKIEAMKAIDSICPLITFQRVDFTLYDPKQDAMDNNKARDVYIAGGRDMFAQIDFAPFYERMA